MKRILLSAGILGMLAIGPASAALTLDFGTGSATSPSGWIARSRRPARSALTSVLAF